MYTSCTGMESNTPRKLHKLQELIVWQRNSEHHNRRCHVGATDEAGLGITYECDAKGTNHLYILARQFVTQDQVISMQLSRLITFLVLFLPVYGIMASMNVPIFCLVSLGN